MEDTIKHVETFIAMNKDKHHVDIQLQPPREHENGTLGLQRRRVDVGNDSLDASVSTKHLGTSGSASPRHWKKIPQPQTMKISRQPQQARLRDDFEWEDDMARWTAQMWSQTWRR